MSISRMSIRKKDETKPIKCVVWDLDNTVWNNILLEDKDVHLREEVVQIIKSLDQRGILNSIASKGDYELAMTKLEEYGLAEYFLYPQINWNSKVTSITEIAKSINIGINTIAFVDDQISERAEVQFSMPEVLCLDATDLGDLLKMFRMNPDYITPDSMMRRPMYISDMKRKRLEEEYIGPKEEFLATLGMTFTIYPAEEEDLLRAEELTRRTNQLNTTGYTYSREILNVYRQSQQHMLLVAQLEDRFGTYGTIGLALLECQEEMWIIKLLLMSCRVMSMGTGTILLNYIMRLAKDKGVSLRAEFIPNGRNRLMHITYMLANFREAEKKDGGLLILENDLSLIQQFPKYVKVNVIS